jgi:hypothetical protein
LLNLPCGDLGEPIVQTELVDQFQRGRVDLDDAAAAPVAALEKGAPGRRTTSSTTSR